MLPESEQSAAIKDDLTLSFDELGIRLPDRVVVESFLGLLRAKDEATYEHSLRVGMIAKDIGKYLHLDQKILMISGLLHDVGKIEIPIEVLRKTEGWSDEDTEKIKKHVLYGYDKLKDRFGFVAEIILLHHRFQKNGYPESLPPFLHEYSPDTIDLIFRYARLLVMADTFDALHRENYKFGYKHKLNNQEIKEELIISNPDDIELIEELYSAKIFK